MERIEHVTHVDGVRLSDDGTAVVIVDQTQLPNRLVYRTLRTLQEVYDAIYTLQVRGAPAIGICAGYAAYCLARTIPDGTPEAFCDLFEQDCRRLAGARPTAVNLRWALDRMQAVARAHASEGRAALLACLRRECEAIHAEDIAMCRSISEYGLSLLHDGDGVLTHCNAGPLATSRYGTAQGPFFLARERGMHIRVFADETRPLLQGARLTSYELSRAGVDVTLICDNMAGVVMKNGWVNACFVGCDRVAANGDTANKIGTSSVAILARYYGVPFYVLGPTSTIDMDCAGGQDIEIEQRPESEIREKFYREPMAPAGVRCYNPAFDVTDHSLITAIVTEKGICRPPYEDSLQRLFAR